jgi:hypothetical protein
MNDFWAYDLEAYFGDMRFKRPDHLLVGRVGEGALGGRIDGVQESDAAGPMPWENSKMSVPALGKGRRRRRGRAPLGMLLPFCPWGESTGLLRSSSVRWVQSTGNSLTPSPGSLGHRKRPAKIIPSWRGKEIVVVQPLWGKKFGSLREFWVYLGIRGRGEV